MARPRGVSLLAADAGGSRRRGWRAGARVPSGLLGAPWRLEIANLRGLVVAVALDKPGFDPLGEQAIAGQN